MPARTFTRRDWLELCAAGAAGLSIQTRSALGDSASSAQKGLIRLTLNENPFGPSPLAKAAIQNDLDGLHRYVAEEAAAFARQLAAHEGVAPEQILLGEVLAPLGMQLSLRGGPGGEFVYSVPGYPAVVDAAARVGGKVIAVPLDARFENDLPALAQAVTPRTRAVFLVNPHNPSGTVNSIADFAAFVRAVAQRSVVILDEAYLEFSDDFAARTGTGFTRAGDNVVVFRTFSKLWGLAALPLGYAIAPRPLAALLRKAGVGSTHELNRLAVTAASASLRDSGYVERVRKAVATERARWHAFLDERKLRRTESQANFVYFDAGRPQAEVASGLLAEGIAIGRAFPPHDRWVRITIGLPEENARARSALSKVLRA